MKKGKKFLSVLLTAALVSAALSMGAFAAGKANGESTTITNEYEMLLQTREAQQRENTLFRSAGADYAELAYLERAALPEETLRDMGYSQEQISILKAYDGGPLEEHPELRAASSNLKVTAKKDTMGKRLPLQVLHGHGMCSLLCT